MTIQYFMSDQTSFEEHSYCGGHKAPVSDRYLIDRKNLSGIGENTYVQFMHTIMSPA